MLRFQLIVPPPKTLVVDGILEAHTGSVSNIIRLPHVASEPHGDVVLCDVVRSDATDFLADLHRAGLDDDGSISVESVDLSLSQTASSTNAAVFGGDDDAVVWQEVEARAGDEVRISVTFVIYMVVATMIASIGIVTDQPILIVGAMVVGPDFGPLASMAVGIVRRRPSVTGRSVLALTLGYGIGIVLTIPFALLLRGLHLFVDDPFTQQASLTAFIWEPNALSYIVGFLAGIAGMLSLTSPKSGALIGVLISVTTVPAAGAAALAVAYAQWMPLGTSLLQLFVNLLAIVTACTVTLIVQIRVVRRNERRRTERRAP